MPLLINLQYKKNKASISIAFVGLAKLYFEGCNTALRIIGS